MFASDVATITMFSGLGLVALALGLLARRTSKPALAIGLAGLLPLTGGATWLARSAPFDQVQRLSELTAEQDNAIGRQQEEITQLRRTVKLLSDWGAPQPLPRPPVAGAEQQAAPSEGKRDLDAQLAELTKQLQKTETDLVTAFGDRNRLKTDLARTIEERNQAKADLAKEAGERKRLESLIEKAVAAKPTRTADNAKAVDPQRLQSDLDAAKKRLQEEQREHERARVRAEEAIAKSAQLQRDLDKLRAQIDATGKPLPSTPSDKTAGNAPINQTGSIDTPARPASPAPKPLQILMDKRLDTDFYTAEPIPDEAELVTGSKGRWYRIAVKAAGGKPLLFPDRKFEVKDAAQDVAMSARQLVTDLLGQLGKTAKAHRVFVRGGADSRPVLGGGERPGIDTLQVYARGSDGRYATGPSPHRISTPVRNADLPILRAHWLRGVIGPGLSATGVTSNIAILDNPPAPGEPRTAEIILFVAW